jgi:GT2 family glycosyltransferase
MVEFGGRSWRSPGRNELVDRPWMADVLRMGLKWWMSQRPHRHGRELFRKLETQSQPLGRDDKLRGAPQAAAVEPSVDDCSGSDSGPSGPPELTLLERHDQDIAALEMSGVLNRGWYGSEPIPPNNCYRPGSSPEPAVIAAGLRQYERDSAEIQRLYFNGPPPLPPWVPERFLPFATIDRILASRRPAAVPDSSTAPTFSLLTTVGTRLDYFEQTARSVAALAVAWEAGAVEWVIHNDEPRVANDTLLARIPTRIRPYARLIGGQANLGVPEGMNQAVLASAHEWLLVLDADDLILPQAIEVLRHYIGKYPKCRYISSARIDIDDQNRILRFRRHARPPSDIYSAGMIAGHLRAMRRDIFDDLGLFEGGPCNLAEDWELALRVARREPLLLIPDHLYAYRLHTESISFVNLRRQEIARRHILRTYVSRLLPDVAGSRAPRREASCARRSMRRGATIIRTKGQRLDLLAETIASVEAQQGPLKPVVVVHGDEETRAMVAGQCASISPAAVVLHAADLSRGGGYAANVGLDYVKARADEFDFVGFLDAGAVHTAKYAPRMAAALELSGADLVYAQSGRREPTGGDPKGPGLLPAACLVAAHFMGAFALRLDALVRSGVGMDEEMQYLEDREFLLVLLGTGLTFAPLFETVTRWCAVPDGRGQGGHSSGLRAACERRCLYAAGAAARVRGLPWFYGSLTGFDFDARPPLSAEEEQQVWLSRRVFETAAVAAAGLADG